MLDNTLQFSVDVANDDVLVNLDFERSEEYLNRSVYTGQGHTLVNREIVAFYRTPVKAVGNYRGPAKSSFKLTTDVTVDGVDTSTSLIAPLIMEASFSVPIGTDDAAVEKMRQTMLSILSDDALFSKHVKKLEI